MVQKEGAEVRAGRLSPDGRWLAYQSNESGREEVYITTFPGGEGPWQVSTTGGSDPTWSPHGTELLYLNGERLMAATVTFQPSVRATNHRIVLDVFAPRWFGDYDVHPDGDLFVMARVGGDPVRREIVVVLNWFDELRAVLGP